MFGTGYSVCIYYFIKLQWFPADADRKLSFGIEATMFSEIVKPVYDTFPILFLPLPPQVVVINSREGIFTAITASLFIPRQLA